MPYRCYGMHRQDSATGPLKCLNDIINSLHCAWWKVIPTAGHEKISVCVGCLYFLFFYNPLLKKIGVGAFSKKSSQLWRID